MKVLKILLGLKRLLQKLLILGLSRDYGVNLCPRILGFIALSSEVGAELIIHCFAF